MSLLHQLSGPYRTRMNRPRYRGDLLVKVPRIQKPHSLVACGNSVQLQQVEYSRLSPTGLTGY